MKYIKYFGFLIMTWIFLIYFSFILAKTFITLPNDLDVVVSNISLTGAIIVVCTIIIIDNIRNINK